MLKNPDIMEELTHFDGTFIRSAQFNKDNIHLSMEEIKAKNKLIEKNLKEDDKIRDICFILC